MCFMGGIEEHIMSKQNYGTGAYGLGVGLGLIHRYAHLKC